MDVQRLTLCYTHCRLNEERNDLGERILKIQEDDGGQRELLLRREREVAFLSLFSVDSTGESSVDARKSIDSEASVGVAAAKAYCRSLHDCSDRVHEGVRPLTV